MRLELNTRSHKFFRGVSRMGLIIAGIPIIHSIMWTPGPLSQTYAVLDWVLASSQDGLGVGYGHEWNSRLATLKLDSRIKLLTVFKLSSVAQQGWEPKKPKKKKNVQPICEHWGSLPHPVPWHCCCAYRPSEPLLAWVVLKKSCPSTGVVWLVRSADYTILAESQFKETERYAIVLGQYRTYFTLDGSQSMWYLIESAAMRILKILKTSCNSWSLSPWVVKDVKVLQ